MPSKAVPVVRVIRTGLINYNVGTQLQSLLSNQNVEELGEFRNYLILQEYHPVYTVGIKRKGYTEQDEMRLRTLGAEFYRTNRGGLITFHGHGQLVAYPILHLKQFQPKMRWYVNTLEQWIINTCKEMGVKNATRTEHTGIWVDEKKICAIGVHGSRYVTTHGIGLNCCTEMKWFEHIVPCGLEGKGVTSLSEQLGRTVTIEETAKILVKTFAKSFECHTVEESVEENINQTIDKLKNINNKYPSGL